MLTLFACSISTQRSGDARQPKRQRGVLENRAGRLGEERREEDKDNRRGGGAGQSRNKRRGMKTGEASQEKENEKGE